MRFVWTFPLWTLLLCSAFASRTVEGQHRVIGSFEPVVAAPGDDVVLPCRLDPPLDLRRFTLEWSRSDLSGGDYVHLYRNRREVPDMKIRSYVGRTALFSDQLKDGNLSLKIVNVTQADAGRYRCFIPKLKSPAKESAVQLVVDPDYGKTWTTEMPLHPTDLQTPDPGDMINGVQSRPIVWILPTVVCIGLLVGGVGAYSLIRWRQKRDCVTYDAASSKPLPV